MSKRTESVPATADRTIRPPAGEADLAQISNESPLARAGFFIVIGAALRKRRRRCLAPPPLAKALFLPMRTAALVFHTARDPLIHESRDLIAVSLDVHKVRVA